jgi:hypothetical protein
MRLFLPFHAPDVLERLDLGMLLRADCLLVNLSVVGTKGARWMGFVRLVGLLKTSYFMISSSFCLTLVGWPGAD